MLLAILAIYTATGLAIDSFFYDATMSDEQAIKRMLWMMAAWPIVCLCWLGLLIVVKKMKRAV